MSEAHDNLLKAARAVGRNAERKYGTYIVTGSALSALDDAVAAAAHEDSVQVPDGGYKCAGCGHIDADPIPTIYLQHGKCRACITAPEKPPPVAPRCGGPCVCMEKPVEQPCPHGKPRDPASLPSGPYAYRDDEDGSAVLYKGYYYQDQQMSGRALVMALNEAYHRGRESRP